MQVRRVEVMKTNWAQNYIHLQDAIVTNANAVNHNDLCKIVMLPSSFVNSLRYLAEYTQNTYFYIRSYRHLDLFITFMSTSVMGKNYK